MSIIEAVPHRPEADSFQVHVSLANLKQALAARWLVVVTTAVLTTALVGAYVWIWPATYQVTVMIAADSDKDTSRKSFYSGWNVFRQERLADEGALMTSPPVLKETIRRLDLQYEDVYHPFLSYVTHLWSISAIGNAYRKVKYWIFPRTRSPYAPTPEEILANKTYTDFRDGVWLEPLKETSIGMLTVWGSSQRVAEIANTMADVYLEQRRERQMKEARQAHASLTEEVRKVQSELARIDAEASKFRTENSLLLQYEKDKVQIGNFESRRLAVGELEAQIAQKEAVLRSTKRNLAIEEKFIDSNQVFKVMAAQDIVPKLEAQLAATLQSFRRDSPEVREIEEQIRAAMATIEGRKSSVVVRNSVRVGESYELLRRREVDLEAQLAGDRASLRKKTAELERERLLLQALPEKLKVNHEYERALALSEGTLASLHEKLSVATVSLATARSAPPAFRVIEYAPPPEKPIWPRTKWLLMGAIVFGLLLGSLAALLLELAFVRVNRYRLWEKNAVYRVFALVDQDERFLNALYAGTAQRRLAGDSAQP